MTFVLHHHAPLMHTAWINGTSTAAGAWMDGSETVMLAQMTAQTISVAIRYNIHSIGKIRRHIRTLFWLTKQNILFNLMKTTIHFRESV